MLLKTLHSLVSIVIKTKALISVRYYFPHTLSYVYTIPEKIFGMNILKYLVPLFFLKQK